MQSGSPGKASAMVLLRTEWGPFYCLLIHSILLALCPCSPPCDMVQVELTPERTDVDSAASMSKRVGPGLLGPRGPERRQQGLQCGRLPPGCGVLCSAPLGSAGAGGVTVSGQDFVSDPAALPLVRPVFTPQV